MTARSLNWLADATAQHGTAQHGTAQHSTAQHSTASSEKAACQAKGQSCHRTSSAAKSALREQTLHEAVL